MKILFIGLGSIGQRHLRNLRRIMGDSVEVIAYRVKRQVPVLNDHLQVVEGAHNLAKRYNLLEFNNLDQALAEKPDIAFITNPSSMHVRTALKAAEAGCHLFIEKPLSADLKEVDCLIELVEQKRLVVAVGYQLRFHPGLQQIAAWLKEGRIGRLAFATLMQGEYLPGFHPYEDYRTSYAARQELGGGVILTQIHEFDYARWFFGLPRRIFAVGGKLSHLEIDVEDTATVLMEYESEGRIFPVTLVLDYLQSPPNRSCRVVGEEGKILLDFHAKTVRLHQRSSEKLEEHKIDLPDQNCLFMDELKQFLEAVEGRVTPSVDLRFGVDSLRMALAARKSLESGKVVSLK